MGKVWKIILAVGVAIGAILILLISPFGGKHKFKKELKENKKKVDEVKEKIKKVEKDKKDTKTKISSQKNKIKKTEAKVKNTKRAKKTIDSFEKKYRRKKK